MSIKVKLFSTLRENRDKVLFLEPENNLTIGTVLEKLSIAIDEVAIIIHNGFDDAADKMLDRPLIDGDYISIFPPVAGG